MREPFFCFHNIYNCIPIHTQEDSFCVGKVFVFPTPQHHKGNPQGREDGAQVPGAGINPSECT